MNKLAKYNKGCWTNILVGVLLMCAGSLDRNLWIMFLGFFNLFYAGVYWTYKITKIEKFVDSSSEEKQ